MIQLLSIPVLLLIVGLIGTWITLHPALTLVLFGLGVHEIPYLADKFVMRRYEQEDFENPHF